MTGFETSRVLIIDDEPEEGLSLAKAFIKLGIATVYLTGNIEDIPEKKLRGLRLIALDMILYEGLNDDEQNINSLLAFLLEVVDENNGPIIIIAWTKKPELIENFIEKLRQVPAIKPISIIPMDKHDMKEDGEYSPVKILEEIRSNISAQVCFNILLEWEQRVFWAASETTRALFELSDGVKVEKKDDSDISDLSQQLELVIKSFTCASVGKQAQVERLDLALFNTLDHLQQDYLERGLYEYNNEAMNQSLNDIIQRDILEGQDTIPRFNTNIITANTIDIKPLRPGSVYCKSKWPPEQTFPLELLGVDTSKLRWDVFDPRIDLQVKEYEKNKEKVKRKERVTLLNNQLMQSDHILVEVTPSCDYYQKKRKILRMIAGRFVSREVCYCIKNCDYLMKVGPIVLPDDGGICYIVLDAHYVIGISEDMITGEPLFRLRKHVMDAVQHWLSSHVSRPGFLSL